jgi:hypothetical protein
MSSTFWGSIESFVDELLARVSFWTLPERKTSTTAPPWSSFLLRLVQRVNDVLQKFQQPTYYESPIFHVSTTRLSIQTADAEVARPRIW